MTGNVRLKANQMGRSLEFHDLGFFKKKNILIEFEFNSFSWNIFTSTIIKIFYFFVKSNFLKQFARMFAFVEYLNI